MGQICPLNFELNLRSKPLQKGILKKFTLNLSVVSFRAFSFCDSKDDRENKNDTKRDVKYDGRLFYLDARYRHLLAASDVNHEKYRKKHGKKRK